MYGFSRVYSGCQEFCPNAKIPRSAGLVEPAVPPSHESVIYFDNCSMRKRLSVSCTVIPCADGTNDGRFYSDTWQPSGIVDPLGAQTPKHVTLRMKLSS